MLILLVLYLFSLTVGLIFGNVYVQNEVVENNFILPDPLKVKNLQVNGNTTMNNQITVGNEAKFDQDIVTIGPSATMTVTENLIMPDGLDVTGSMTIAGEEAASEDYVNTSITNEALMVESQFLTEINFNPEFETFCQALKQNTGTGGVQNVVYTYNGSGILRNFWLSINNVASDDTYIQVLIDGELVWGNALTTRSDGINTIPLSVGMLMGTAVPQVNPDQAFFYQEQYNGSNINGTTLNFGEAFGAYLRIDVPFQTSFQVILFNASNFVYSLQPQFEIIPTSILSLLPYKCYVKPFEYDPTVYDSEYPLLNEQGNGNGVFLFGIKFYITGVSGEWVQSRLRAYKSDNGFGDAVVTPATGFSDLDLNDPDVFAGAVNGEVVYISSGLEDFFLSSNGWVSGLYANPNTGLIESSSIPTGVVADSQVNPYRFMVEDMIRVTGSSYLSVTLPSGDPKVGMSGSMTIYGQCYYYK